MAGFSISVPALPYGAPSTMLRMVPLPCEAGEGDHEVVEGARAHHGPLALPVQGRTP